MKLIRNISKIYSSLIKFFITFLPGEFGNYLRIKYYKKRFKKCGENVNIEIGVDIIGPEFITVGDNVSIDKYVFLHTGAIPYQKVTEKENNNFKNGRHEIEIGSDVHICPFCIISGYGGIKIDNNTVISSGSKLYSMSNTPFKLSKPEEKISLMPYNQAEYLVGPITLNTNVWVGLNVIIMPGCNIGKDSFIASNSIITKSYLENSYIKYVPEKSKREFRFQKR